MMNWKRQREVNMVSKNKRSSLKEGTKGPFDPSLPEEYNYRCSVCGAELLDNEAIIDTRIGMTKFNNEYYDGYMPKVGCPECNNYTME